MSTADLIDRLDAVVAAVMAFAAWWATRRNAKGIKQIDHAVNGHPDVATMQKTVSDLAPGVAGDPDSLMGRQAADHELLCRIAEAVGVDPKEKR